MKSQEQNKKKKRKVLLSLLMILFVGVILTASTYTWFTANKTVTVDSLDVNVSTSTGLQISTDAINWKTIVTRDDIVNASTTGYSAAVNQVPSGQTNPVSTAGEVDGGTGYINMYRGLLSDEGGLGSLKLTAAKSTEENGTEGDFIAFDLFFNTNEAQDIYLTSGSNVIGGKSDGSGTDTSIQNAARVAFLLQGNNPEASNSSASQALKATDATGLKIWEPNADAHTKNGVNNAQTNYGKGDLHEGTGNTPVSYYGVKAAIASGQAQAINSTDGTYFAEVNAGKGLFTTNQSGIPTSAYQQILHLDKGVTKVRIYMWVEGQDVDCEDYASGGDLTFNLQFSSLSAQA